MKERKRETEREREREREKKKKEREREKERDVGLTSLLLYTTLNIAQKGKKGGWVS